MQYNRILFIGANRFAEDGPLLFFVDSAISNGLKVVVYSDHKRELTPTYSEGSFLQAVKRRNCEVFTNSELDLSFVNSFNDGKTIILCVNSHWILPGSLIESFHGNVFNYHNASLPMQRGAACHSWRLMQRINNSALTIHEVVDEIDAGKILIEKEIIFPDWIENSKLTYDYIAEAEKDIFSTFLETDVSVRKSQTDTASFYWPRLDTNKHGFIDWTWTAKEIKSFCDAFDAPFDGAITFLDEVTVRLRSVHLDDMQAEFHPFQSGLIYRTEGETVWVATSSGGLRVEQVEADGSVKLRLGRRLFTPYNLLESARTTRV